VSPSTKGRPELVRAEINVARPCHTSSVLPPRGPRPEAALDAARVTFVISWVIGIPHMFFEVHYPLWLRWIGRVLLILFVVALLAFLTLRGREAMDYRRQQAGH